MSSNWCDPSRTIVSINLAVNYLEAVCIYFVLLFVWGVYRQVHKSLYFGSDKSVGVKANERYIGYGDSHIGNVLKYLYYILILISQILLCTVIWNVICSYAVDVQPYWNERAKAYIIFYCTGITLCLLKHLAEPFLSTFFLLHESLNKCKYIRSRKRSVYLDFLRSCPFVSTFYRKKAESDYRALNGCHSSSAGDDISLPLLRVFVSENNSRYVCHNQVTYTYVDSISDFVSHDQNKLFREVLDDLNNNSNLHEGLSTKQVNELQFIAGKNSIELEIPNIINVFTREMLHPFNILRLGSLFQGLFLRFYIWSLLWFIVVLFTTTKTLKIIINNRRKIKEVLESYIERPVTIKREGAVLRIPSSELVPGDLIFLPEGFVAPCDIYVVSGCVIANESFITGESNPVIKMQIDLDSTKSMDTRLASNTINRNKSNSDEFIAIECMKHEKKTKTCSTFDSINLESDGGEDVSCFSNFGKNASACGFDEIQQPIYMGTKIIGSISSSNNSDSTNSAIGIVYRTGIYSSHGQLLYRTINSFSSASSYSISSIKFLRNIYSLWVVMFIVGIVFILYQNFTLGWSTGSFFFAVGTFIQLLPLWAPTCVQLSLGKSVERLERNSSVKTSFPMDIPVAGKLKVLCLDKTGTLTSNKMMFVGVVSANTNGKRKCNLVSNDVIPHNPGKLYEFPSTTHVDLSAFTKSSDGGYATCQEDASRDHWEYGINKLNLQIRNENNCETSTISIEEEDPLINRRMIETFNTLRFTKKHLVDLPEIVEVSSIVSAEDMTYVGLCCCNNLIPNYKGKETVLLGNDIDKAIFSSTCARIKIYGERRYISLNENLIVNDSVDNFFEYPIEVLRINEFDWNHQCMSVVVHHRLLNKYFVFCKGSLESLVEISADGGGGGHFFPNDSVYANEKENSNVHENRDVGEECGSYHIYDKDLVDAREVLNSSLEMENPISMNMSKNARDLKYKRFLDGDRVVNKYSRLGYYVMGISFKEIKDPVLLDALLNKPKLNVSRRTIESDLTIISYLLFYNNIRPSARDFVENIKSSGIEPVILTGDSPYTALSVAHKSGIVGLNSKVAIGDVCCTLGRSRKKKEVLVWYDYTLEQNNDSIPYEKIYNSNEYDSLVVTSKAFIHLLNEAYKNLNNDDKSHENHFQILPNRHPTLISQLDLIFNRIKIFARSNPEHKRLVICEYKRRKMVTGMMGDGVNDLPAFKMADLSISVHEKVDFIDCSLNKSNESDNVSYGNDYFKGDAHHHSPMTLAFSSFSIDSNNILRVVDLIKEGRASMATTFALFMFLSFQGLFYSIYKNVLFTIAQANLPVMTYVFIDIALVFPSIWLMILCKPKKCLRSVRPTGNLLGPNVIISFLFLLLISLFFYSILITRLLGSSWIIPSYQHNKDIPVERWFQRQDNYEASTTFIWMSLQLSSISLILSFGGHFRERVTRNKFLVLWVLLCHLFILTLCITGPNALTCLFRVNCTNSVDRFWNLELLGFSILTITGGKFQGPGSNNLFPFNWKIEFIFWNYSSIFIMSMVYWWISLRIYSKR